MDSPGFENFRHPAAPSGALVPFTASSPYRVTRQFVALPGHFTRAFTAFTRKPGPLPLMQSLCRFTTGTPVCIMTEPLSPEDAVEQYLASRRVEVTESTLANHRYRLSTFIEWAEANGFEDMRNASGMTAERFKNWKLSEQDLSKVTLKNHLHTFRVFIRYCENIDVVDDGVADKVMVPVVTDEEESRNVFLTHERATTILDYLQRYEYASSAHLVFGILYNTGCRRSALHSLDVKDWHPDDQFLSFRNRPEEGTVLKNRKDGERDVTLTNQRLCHAIGDYIEEQRPAVTDDFDREPLLASKQGRLHSKTIQGIIYKVTRPCWYNEACPHDREPEECESTDYGHYSKCPSSVSPHPVRRSAITHALNSSVPLNIVSERVDASAEVIDKHYREQSLEQERQSRQGYLDNI